MFLGIIGLVDINGTTYFIDSVNYLYRYEAKAQCESMNMTLATFDTKEKWNNMMTWIENTGQYNYAYPFKNVILRF